DVLPVLQVPDNKADAVPCERLQFTKPLWQYIVNKLRLLLAGQWTGRCVGLECPEGQNNKIIILTILLLLCYI
ncbi:MAG: hypothetical protein K8S56_10025, partial [Candidatus Cloacimonetes bacterium]|nr:hypothetical protein [Candidatus Cloacimonadota bacterium]